MNAAQVQHTLEQATAKVVGLTPFTVGHSYAGFDLAPLLVAIDMMMDAGWEGVDAYADGMHAFAKVVELLKGDRGSGFAHALTVTTAVESWRSMCHVSGPYSAPTMREREYYFYQEIAYTLPLPDGRFINLWVRSTVPGSRNLTPLTVPLAFGQRWWQEWRERRPLDFLKRFIRESRGTDDDEEEDDTDNEGDDE